MTGEVEVNVLVGWAQPESGELHFNFHFEVDGVEWTETISYPALEALENCVKSNGETLAHVHFPRIDRLSGVQLNKLLHSKKYNLINLKELEKYSRGLENWLTELMQNLSQLDDESQQNTRLIFFKPSDKIEVYEKLCLTVQQNIQITNAQNKESKKKNKSVFTKVTHKLFKSRKPPALTTLMENGELNESNLSAGGQYTSTWDGSTVDMMSHGDTCSEMSPGTLSSPRKGGFMKSFARKLGGTRSMTHGERNAFEEEDAFEQAVKAKASMQVEVQRGQMIKAHVLVYDIILRITSKKYAQPVVYSTFQRYKSFKNLYGQLVAINTAMVKASRKKQQQQQQQQGKQHNGGNNHNGSDNNSGSGGGEVTNADPSSVSALSEVNFMARIRTPFPRLKMKSYVGMRMNDSDLSVRTRCLDAWLRDVCTNYRHMPEVAKNSVRAFLKFDLSQPKHIFVQDHLTWGAIDQPSNEHGTGSSVLIVQRSALDNMNPAVMNQLEVMSAHGGGGGGHSSGDGIRHRTGSVNTAGTPMSKHQSDTGSVLSLQNLAWETATEGNGKGAGVGHGHNGRVLNKHSSMSSLQFKTAHSLAGGNRRATAREC